jgi:hypothetical protein
MNGIEPLPARPGGRDLSAALAMAEKAATTIALWRDR